MHDNATGLQNNLNRWYDPAVGRWLSQDPIGFDAGDGNLYRYVGNEPTIMVDPSGMMDAERTLGLPPPNPTPEVVTVTAVDSTPQGGNIYYSRPRDAYLRACFLLYYG